MKWFIHFDENNISKMILKYSFVMVAAIAVMLILIYTPKYYYEFKDNIESTSNHLDRLFRERIKFEVDAIVENTDYRTRVHSQYIELKTACPDHGVPEGTVKQIVLEEITEMNMKGSQEYIFIYELLKPEGGKDFAVMLVNPNRPDLVGNLIDEDYRDIEGFEFRKEFMRQIRESGEAFVSYVYRDPVTQKNDLKTSYFRLYPKFQWIFAQGYYQSQIEDILAADVKRYKKDFIFRIALIFGLISVFLTMYYFLFRNFAEQVQETIIKYRSDLEIKNKMLETEIELSDAKRKELAEYTDYISKIYESIPVGIVLIDTSDRKIVKINEAGLETLGYEPDELIGKICNFSFCPAEINKCPILDEGKNIDNSERKIVHKSGREIAVLKKACLIDVNEQNFILESFIDITRIKEAEKELIRLKEKAEQASYEKSRFLANMSHEIRTPMNAIHGMTDLLSETELSKDQKELADTIKASSDILVRILNDILDISKIESGNITVEKTEFDLNKLIRSVSASYEIKLRNEGVEFKHDYDPKAIEGYFISDSLKLSQILNNLMGNACKFTHEGSVTLSVKITDETQDGTVILFSVKDTGIGIDEDKIGTIFERFSQADVSTTRRYGGTGLGLTISKKLVELLGGDLKVESSPGKGSRFYFTLNLQRADKTKHNENSMNDFNGSIKDIEKLNILVAEDNIFNQKYISALLKKKNISFKIVENGREALDELAKNSYDLILMDGQMPVMDGISAAKAIRKTDSDYFDIPIIALTASALLDDRKKFMDAGMNDFIPKPVDQKELMQKISKYCTVSVRNSDLDEYEENNNKNIKTDDNKWQVISIDDFRKKQKSFGRESFSEILGLFAKELPRKISKIESAILKNDHESLKFEAHGLKGVSLNFEAREFNRLCIKLDEHAQSNSFAQAKLYFEKLKISAEKYYEEIIQFIEEAENI